MEHEYSLIYIKIFGTSTFSVDILWTLPLCRFVGHSLTDRKFCDRENKNRHVVPQYVPG